MKRLLTGTLGLLVFVPIAYPQSVPSLVNYQGILTDGMASPVPSGIYGLQFKVWDSPTATNLTDLVWGQQQSVTVQSNGVFNVILGAPGGTPISGAGVNDLRFAFNEPNRFLGVTIVSQKGTSVNNPTEILPRQQFLSAPFAITAGNAAVAGFATNAQIAASVAAASIGTPALASGAVQLQNIAPRAIFPNSTLQNPAPLGAISVSPSLGKNKQFSSEQTVTGLSVTITTSGRPVVVGLLSDGQGGDAFIGVQAVGGSNTSFAHFRIKRDGSEISQYTCSAAYPGSVGPGVYAPSTGLATIDFMASPGTHTYTVTAQGASGVAIMSNSMLVAYEF